MVTKVEHHACRGCGKIVEAINSYTCSACKIKAEYKKNPLLKLWDKFLYT